MTTSNSATEQEALNLEQISKLTDPAQIEKLLQEVILKERDIEDQLDQTLQRRVELDAKFHQLYEHAEILQLSTVDWKTLTDNVCQTFDIAESLSAKVRVLDAAQGRAQQAIQYVSSILERSNCLTGVQEAMARGDYEGAATHLKSFTAAAGTKFIVQASEQKTEEETAAAANDQSSKQLSELFKAKDQLENVIREKLQEAISAGSHRDVIRYIKLFPSLGLGDEGLSSFLAYLTKLVATRSRVDLEQLRASVSPTAGTEFVTALENIFRDAVEAVEANESLLLSDLGGKPALVKAYRALASEADLHAGKLLQMYESVRKLDQLAKRAKERSTDTARLALSGLSSMTTVLGVDKDSDPESKSGEELDPRVVESYLDELTAMLARSEEYLVYVQKRLRDCEATAAAAAAATASAATSSVPVSPRENAEGVKSQEDKNGIENEIGNGNESDKAKEEFTSLVNRAVSALRSGQLPKMIAELAQVYLQLEEFYMGESTSKAIKIDDLTEGALTTSMVDDVFFILMRCTRRSISASSLQCAQACLSLASNILMNDFKAATDSRISKLPGILLTSSASPLPDISSSMGLSSSASGTANALTEEGLDKAIPIINNPDVSADYVLKLKDQLQEVANKEKQVFGSSPNDLIRIQNTLSDLEGSSSQFKQIAAKGLAVLRDAIMVSLNSSIEALQSTQYELSEDEYADNFKSDPWVPTLINSAELALALVRDRLTGNNFENLIALIIDSLVSKLEVAIKQKKFNQLGGLQIERQTRDVVTSLSKLSSRPVRERFAKITQMADILNMESPKEILYFWGENAGSMTWRLTPEEVKNVLRRRTDFKEEEIASINL